MKPFLPYLSIAYLAISTSLLATPSPNLVAEGAILMEPKSNTVIYSKNKDALFYPASTTKVLSTLLLAESLSPETILTKTSDSIHTVPSDSSHIGLQLNDRYTYDAGLHGILMGSDNFISHDMAVAHSGSIDNFASLMTKRAAALGATSSHFVNPHGYHHPDHYTTPYDLALITEAAFDNPLVSKIAGTLDYDFEVLNTSETLHLEHTAPFFDASSPYFNPSVVAAKTGFHTPAGRTLVAKASSNGLDLIAVVMHSDYPSYFEDINKLFDYGFANFEVITSSTDTLTLNNVSYSEWAYPYIQTMASQHVFVPSVVSFMDPTTGYDLIQMLLKSIPTLYINNSMYQLGTNPSSPSILHSPLTPELAQSIFETLTQSLHSTIPSSFVSDALARYIPTPKPILSLEESVYLACTFTGHYYMQPNLALTRFID